MPPDIEDLEDADEPGDGQDEGMMSMSAQDQQLHEAISSCVDSCQGDCMGSCLHKSGFSTLPPRELDPEELRDLRDKSNKPLSVSPCNPKPQTWKPEPRNLSLQTPGMRPQVLNPHLNTQPSTLNTFTRVVLHVFLPHAPTLSTLHPSTLHPPPSNLNPPPSTIVTRERKQAIRAHL